MEYVVLLVLIPIALLLLAVKPLIHALPQFNWVNCPKCRVPARRSSRGLQRRVYACERCGARIERRWGRGARLIEADGDPPER